LEAFVIRSRLALLSPMLGLALLIPVAFLIPVSGQSVVSTHSGVVYFFEGSVFIGDQPLIQKFGKFPDIGEGGELRTEKGRAEVLLTPGVFLRVGENSSIKLVSANLSDTRVELMTGSAILESTEANAADNVSLIYKNWDVRLPEEGVLRIDADPAQVNVYKGQAEVGVAQLQTGGPQAGPDAGRDARVTVTTGQNLPLASVLVPQDTTVASNDPFKAWAMSRSQDISSDNATAKGIVDDPGTVDSSGFAAGAYSYYPQAIVPGLGYPYGMSFWSPFQSNLSAIYFPPYLYSYGSIYSRWPSAVLYPLLVGRTRTLVLPSGAGLTNPTGFPRTPSTITPGRVTPGRVTPLTPVAPRIIVPRGGARVGGRR
jgi:FecR protein